MRPLLRLLLAAMVLAAGCGDPPGFNQEELEKVEVADDNAVDPDEPATSSPSAPGDVPEIRELRFGAVGEAAVPPGDPDGTGTIILILDVVAEEVCYEIVVEQVEPITEAHIHRGPATETGEVVLDLIAPSGDEATRSCASAEPSLIEEMIAHPGRFYVDLHNEDHPDGALRGQLHAGR